MSVNIDANRAELTRLGIANDRIDKVLQACKDKSQIAWTLLFRSMSPLSQDERNQVIDNILQKSGVSLTPTTPASTTSAPSAPTIEASKVSHVERARVQRIVNKFSQVQTRSTSMINQMKKLQCLGNDTDAKRLTDEWDTQKGCSGEAVYVCTHCKANVCSTHSYWIPDKEFPYVERVETKALEVDKTAQEKEQMKKTAIILIILGAILAIAIVGIFLIIYGIMLFMKAKNMMPPMRVNTYPEYTKTINTKWGNQIDLTYQHQGFYTAVHCWQCLNKYHPEYISVGRQIFTKIYDKSIDWKRNVNGTPLNIPEPDRLKCATMAANLFLSDFKFARISAMPMDNGLREMVRPEDFEQVLQESPILYAEQIGQQINKKTKTEPMTIIRQIRYYMPTPIWLLAPVKTRPIEYLTVDKWVERYMQYIKNFYQVF